MKTIEKKKQNMTIEVFSKTCSKCNYGDNCGDRAGDGVNAGGAQANGASNATGTPKSK